MRRPLCSIPNQQLFQGDVVCHPTVSLSLRQIVEFVPMSPSSRHLPRCSLQIEWLMGEHKKFKKYVLPRVYEYAKQAEDE